MIANKLLYQVIHLYSIKKYLYFSQIIELFILLGTLTTVSSDMEAIGGLLFFFTFLSAFHCDISLHAYNVL
jgi:hypothetical protein